MQIPIPFFQGLSEWGWEGSGKTHKGARLGFSFVSLQLGSGAPANPSVPCKRIAVVSRKPPTSIVVSSCLSHRFFSLRVCIVVVSIAMDNLPRERKHPRRRSWWISVKLCTSKASLRTYPISSKWSDYARKHGRIASQRNCARQPKIANNRINQELVRSSRKRWLIAGNVNFSIPW